MGEGSTHAGGRQINRVQAQGQPGLGPHRDESELSFNLLLSDAGDFEGGGTYFPGITPPVVRPQRGDLLSHYGGLTHASVPTTGGQRYILVGFLRSPRLLEQLGDRLPSEEAL